MCVWLALHPNAPGCQIDRALAISAGSRTSTMSRLRGWLGPDVVPHNRAAGRYRIATVTDWHEVQNAVCDSAGLLRPTASRADLTTALTLVRGEPLADIAAAWADSERLQMTLLIADVAHRLARAHLREQNVPGAIWAVSRGLLAVPDDDQLRQYLRRIRDVRIRRAA